MSGYVANDQPTLTRRQKEEQRRLDQEQAQLAREAQEKAEKPLKDALAQRNALLLQNAKNVAAFFSLTRDEMLARSIPESAIDLGFGDDFPLADEPLFTADKNEIFFDFAGTLEARGIALTLDGVVRLGRFATMLTDGRGFKLTQELLDAALVRLTELNCWQAGEVTGELPKREVAPQAAPQETEAERRARLLEESVENADTTTRAGRAKAIGVLNSLWAQDVVNRYRDFAEFMDKTYGVDVLTDKICREYGQFCDLLNLAPAAASSLNAWRRELHRRRYFVTSLLTKDEAIAASLEQSDLNSREVRLNVARRIYEANSTK